MDNNRVAELISSPEQATLMAHQIGATVDQNQLLHISSSLRIAHHRLSSFLSTIPSTAPDKCISPVEPMQLGEEEEAEERDSAVEKVTVNMKECFIRNKRAKRTLSPSSSAIEERSGLGGELYGFDFDSNASKSRALDLIYQFHG